MPETIDVLCAIDCDSLPKLSQDPDDPAQGLNSSIYMIVRDANALSGQAGPELNVLASPGDGIRWSVTSLSGNFEHSVHFYRFQASAGKDLLTPPVLVGGVHNHGHFTVERILPMGSIPWQGKSEPVPHFHYESVVQAAGKVTCQWWFQVNKTSDGSLAGYGMWSPFITIGNRREG
jgi:nematocidal protein AidA